MHTVSIRLLPAVLWLSFLGCREANPEFVSDGTVGDSGSGEADSGSGETDSGSGETDTGEGDSEGCSSSNCECGMACGPGQTCEQGECECKGEDTACPSGCFNTDEDDHHCGDCTTVCPMGKSCRDGICD
jgi:hypothetical protein